MGLLAMTVQRRYQHHHPVLVFLQTDYVLSGQENAKEQEEECVRTLVESNQRLKMCVCWFSAKHTCLIKAIGDSQDIVSTC
jgi:sulfur relay (sulfurtransferase) complex TusBCD TusD component (DsrE family)